MQVDAREKRPTRTRTQRERGREQQTENVSDNGDRRQPQHWQTAPEPVACAPGCLPRHAACLGSWFLGALRTVRRHTPRARRSDAAKPPADSELASYMLR
jgi:hypothetical protein